MRQFDYSKLKDLKFDSETLGLISKIREFKGRQELFLTQEPVVLEHLVEIAKIQSTENSNKIEGIITADKRIELFRQAVFFQIFNIIFKFLAKK